MTCATHIFRLRFGAAVWVVLLAVAAVQAAAAQPRFPQLTGRIVDEARLLSASDEAALERELAALERKSGDQVVVDPANARCRATRSRTTATGWAAPGGSARRARTTA